MRVGWAINGWRKSNQIGIREAAKMIGISHSTLGRIENGKNCDGKTMAKVMLWLFDDTKGDVDEC